MVYCEKPAGIARDRQGVNTCWLNVDINYMYSIFTKRNISSTSSRLKALAADIKEKIFDRLDLGQSEGQRYPYVATGHCQFYLRKSKERALSLVAL